MREKKGSLRFRKKEHSKIGIISTIISIVAWGIFIALSVYSTITEGNVEKIMGVVGILDAVLAFFGAVLSIKGLQERDVSYSFSIIGIILNGTLFVIYFLLYFMGVAIRV